MMMVPVVPETRVDDKPGRVCHQHQQGDADDHKATLNPVLALASGLVGGALGEAGGLFAETTIGSSFAFLQPPWLHTTFVMNGFPKNGVR